MSMNARIHLRGEDETYEVVLDELDSQRTLSNTSTTNNHKFVFQLSHFKQGGKMLGLLFKKKGWKEGGFKEGEHVL